VALIIATGGYKRMSKEKDIGIKLIKLYVNVWDQYEKWLPHTQADIGAFECAQKMLDAVFHSKGREAMHAELLRQFETVETPVTSISKLDYDLLYKAAMSYYVNGAIKLEKLLERMGHATCY
jgi:hypothetical protein